MKTLQTNELNTLDTAQLLALIKRNRWKEASKEPVDKIVQTLSSRGLDKDTIRRISSLDTDPFDEALKHYLAFKWYSKRVFWCYFMFIGSILISYLLEPTPVLSTILILIFTTLIAFVVGSLVQQSRFYRVVGEYQSEGSPLVFFFLGMPLYFLMYFSYRQKMEAHLNKLV